MKYIAVLLGTVMALSATGAGAAPPQKATGGVRFITDGGNEAHAAFNAHATLKGQVEVRVVDPAGQLVQRWHGSVDCYQQTGSMATFSGMVTQLVSGTNPNPGMWFIITVIDGGEGRNAAADEFAMQRHATDPGCEQALDTNTEFAGNIQVHG